MAQAPAPESVAATEQRTSAVILTSEQRRALLGKIAEFELAIVALPPREQGFVLAIIMDPGNASAAARKAGCPEKTAGIQASKMLSMPRVAHAISIGNQLREDRTMVTSDRTLHELAIVAYSSIDDYQMIDGRLTVREGIPEHNIRAVQSVEYHETEHYLTKPDGEKVHTHTTRRTRIRLWSKPDTLRMLALYQNLIRGANIVNNVFTNNDNRQIVMNTWKFGDKTLQF